MQLKDYLRQSKNNEGQNFFDQILTNFFHIYRNRELGAERYCKKRSDIEVVKLPETILSTTMLEKILSINVLELFVSLVGCSIRGRK